MKRKNIVLFIAIALCLVLCLFVFLIKVVEVNIIKHDEITLGELSVEYYGGFDIVRIVKVYDGAIRRGTFELSVDKELLDRSNECPPYLDDLNGDGHEDILIPHSTDSNLDVRYAAFIWNNETKMFEECELLADIANISINDSDVLSSNMELRIVTIPEQKNIPEEYEKYYISAEYKRADGKITPIRQYTLIYYSENDIYCHVMEDYNPENGELISTVEDWMTPEEAEKLQSKK